MLKEFTKTVVSAFSFDPLKDYKISHEHSFHAFRGQIFLVEEAVERRTGKLVSIFSVKRRDLQVRCGGEAYVQQFIARAQRSVSFLSQLDYPFLLTIEKPFTDGGSTLFFVTERITGYLPTVKISDVPLQVRKFELQHMLGTIRFLHERCNLLLLDFGPHSIYLSASGWKLGDLSQALLKNDLEKFSPIGDFSHVFSPQMNYIADECIAYPKLLKEETPAAIKQTVDTLFDGPAPVHSSNTVIPSVSQQCDVFSFLITAVEILEAKRLFTCCPGNISERKHQVARVRNEVSSQFPAVESLSAPLLPPLSSISMSAALNGEDIRMLLEVEKLATNPSEAVSFDVLNALYHGIEKRLYVNELLIQVVLHFSLRAAKQQRMLRFTLPLVIQCAGVLAVDNNIPKELKDFLTTVVEGILRAPTFEITGVLAQQLLQKLPIIKKVFPSEAERLTIFLPLYFKCMSSPIEPLQILSIRSLNALLREMANSTTNSSGCSSSTDPKAGPTCVKLPEKFVERLLVVMEHGCDEAFSLVMETTSTVLTMLSHEQKTILEVSLIGGLRSTLINFPKRLAPILSILYSVQQAMPLEHTASSSIPLLSTLLLSSRSEIRNYAASTIVQRLSLFDAKIDSLSASMSVMKDFSSTLTSSKSYSMSNDIHTNPRANETQVLSPSFVGLSGGAAEYQNAMFKTNGSASSSLQSSDQAYEDFFSSIPSNPRNTMNVGHTGTQPAVGGSSGNSGTSSQPLLPSSSTANNIGVGAPSYSSFDPASSIWNSSPPSSNSVPRPSLPSQTFSDNHPKPSPSQSPLESLWN